MTVAVFDQSKLKLSTALRLGVGSPAFKVFDSAGALGWTNNDLMDFSIPKFIMDRTLVEYGDVLRIPRLNAISFGRLRDKYAAEDGKLRQLHAFELEPHSFLHDPSAPNPLARDSVALVNRERELATQVDQRYLAYFHCTRERTRKPVRFFGMETNVTNASLAGAIAVVHDDLVIGVCAPLMTDGDALYRKLKRQ